MCHQLVIVRVYIRVGEPVIWSLLYWCLLKLLLCCTLNVYLFYPWRWFRNGNAHLMYMILMTWFPSCLLAVRALLWKGWLVSQIIDDQKHNYCNFQSLLRGRLRKRCGFIVVVFVKTKKVIVESKWAPSWSCIFVHYGHFFDYSLLINL